MSVRYGEEAEAGRLAVQTCMLRDGSHSLQAGHNIGLDEIVQRGFGMPQGYTLGIPGSCKRGKYHTLVDCIVIALVALVGGIVRDYKVTESRVGRLVDIGIDSQQERMREKLSASARKSHCSAASSGHAVSSDCSCARMLNMLLRLLQPIRGCSETVDRWGRSRRPQHQNSAFGAAAALETLAEMDSPNTGVCGLVAFH